MIFKYINILYRPNFGWNEVKINPPKSKSTLKNLVIPVAFISSFIVFFAVYYISKGSIHEMFKYSAFTFFKWIITLLIAGWAVNGLSGGFKGSKNFNLSFLLVSLPASIFMIISSTGKLFPMYSRIFDAVGIYSLFIFYMGVNPILNIPKDKAIGFSFISLLIFAITKFLFDIFFSSIFNVPFHL